MTLVFDRESLPRQKMRVLFFRDLRPVRGANRFEFRTRLPPTHSCRRKSQTTRSNSLCHQGSATQETLLDRFRIRECPVSSALSKRVDEFDPGIARPHVLITPDNCGLPGLDRRQRAPIGQDQDMAKRDR